MSELAPMREQVYTDPRPKEHFDRFHERARTREPDWAYEPTRLLTSLYAYAGLRARAIAPSNVPGQRRGDPRPNHFSFMDHFLMGCYIRRKVRFMAKSQLFKGPMQFIYTHGGVFPVRRGRATKRCSRPPMRSSRAGARSRCTARGGARAPATSRSRQSAGSGAWRSKRGPRSADCDPRLLEDPQLEAPAPAVEITVQYGQRAAPGAGPRSHARPAAGRRRRGAGRDQASVRRPGAARAQGRAAAGRASSVAPPRRRRGRPTYSGLRSAEGPRRAPDHTSRCGAP